MICSKDFTLEVASGNTCLASLNSLAWVITGDEAGGGLNAAAGANGIFNFDSLTTSPTFETVQFQTTIPQCSDSPLTLRISSDLNWAIVMEHSQVCVQLLANGNNMFLMCNGDPPYSDSGSDSVFVDIPFGDVPTVITISIVGTGGTPIDDPPDQGQISGTFALSIVP